MKSMKCKRKFHKSGEKISPKDKKIKTKIDQLTPLKMASVDRSPTQDPISDIDWNKLVDKIDRIERQTEDISDIKKVVAELKNDFKTYEERSISLETALNEYSSRTEAIEKKLA